MTAWGRANRLAYAGLLALLCVTFAPQASASGSSSSDYGWRRATTSSQPPAGPGTYLASGGGQTILLEGPAGTNTAIRTWQWSDGRWSRLHPRESPAAREGAAFAWDGTRFLLFGGDTKDGQPDPGVSVHYSGDTWAFAKGQWTLLHPTSAPHARVQALMSGLANGGLVLFGGSYTDRDTFIRYSDTWTWNGHTWHQVATRNDPGYRYAASIGLDQKTGQVLLAGGNDSNGVGECDTWTWSPNTSRWAEALSPGRAPCTTDSTPLIEVDGHLQLQSGQCQHSWAWTGTTWVVLDPSEPSPRQYGTAADTVDGPLLFGGYNESTSQYDNTTWTWQDPPSPRPSPSATVPKAALASPYATISNSSASKSPSRRVPGAARPSARSLAKAATTSHPVSRHTTIGWIPLSLAIVLSGGLAVGLAFGWLSRNAAGKSTDL